MLIHLAELLQISTNKKKKKKIVKDTANIEEVTNNMNINNKGGPRNETSSVKTTDVEQPALEIKKADRAVWRWSKQTRTKMLFCS